MTNQQKVIQELINKTYQELSKPQQTTSTSREWKDPEGYKYLTSWSNSVLLRYFIRLFTPSLPKNEYRRKAQLDDAGRSVIRNQEEGFKRPTTIEYLQFLGYSQASLEEVKGDIRELTEDGFLPSSPGTSLVKINIDLKTFNTALIKFKGDYRTIKENELTPSPPKQSLYQPLTILYPPLNKIQIKDLTYEIFMEFINKTDYLLRKLVESLEKKLNQGRKTYQIEQAKIKDKLR